MFREFVYRGFIYVDTDEVTCKHVEVSRGLALVLTIYRK